METGNQILEALLNFWTLLFFFQNFSIKPRTLPGTKSSSTWPTIQLFHDSTWRWPDASPRCLKVHLMKSPEVPDIPDFADICQTDRNHREPMQMALTSCASRIPKRSVLLSLKEQHATFTPAICLFAQGLQMILQRLGWKTDSSHRLITKVATVSYWRPSFCQFFCFWFERCTVFYSYIRDIIFVEIRPSSFTSQRLEICAKIARTWFFSPPQSDFNLAWTRRTVATRTGQKLQYKRRGGMQTLVWQDFPNLRAGTTGSGAHVQLCATISSAYPIHPANGPGAQGHFQNHWKVKGM